MSPTGHADCASGVQLWLSPTLIEQLQARLSVDEGVRLSRGGQRWIARPSDSWRPPSDEEVRSLTTCSSGAPSFENAIGLFEMPTDGLARAVDFLDWYFSSPARSIPDCRLKERQIGLLDSIYSGHGAESTFMGVSSGPPNQSTVARRRDTGEPVGLHLDNYDGLPAADRARARNRICVNVGAQSRYLLFLPLQACGMVSMVLDGEGIFDEASAAALNDHRELVSRYFRLFPDSRIYRIEIKPGEGYVAPTENVVHEGSTLGTNKRDYSLVWLGRFNWLNVNGRGRPV